MFLGSYPDTAAPSLTIYNLPVTIPANTTAGAYVIQTVSRVGPARGRTKPSLRTQHRGRRALAARGPVG